MHQPVKATDRTARPPAMPQDPDDRRAALEARTFLEAMRGDPFNRTIYELGKTLRKAGWLK